MNRIVVTFFIFFYFLIARSQDNPYAIFGHKTIEYRDISTSKSFKINDKNKFNSLSYLAKEQTILLLDSSDKVVQRLFIKPHQLIYFVGIDPHTLKYPELSPYNAFADNPIVYEDPDGRDIIIRWGGKGGYQEMTYAYQENRNYEDYTDHFVKNTLMTLDYLYQKKALELSFDKEKPDEKIDVLQKIITDKEVNVLVMNSAENSFTPSLNLISFNPFRGIEFRKEADKPFIEANTGRNSAASLFAHELIHAYNKNYDFDEYEKRRTTPIDDYLQNPPFFPNLEEVYVTSNLANQVNTNLGEDLRTNYKRLYYLTEEPTTITPRLIE